MFGGYETYAFLYKILVTWMQLTVIPVLVFKDNSACSKFVDGDTKATLRGRPAEDITKERGGQNLSSAQAVFCSMSGAQRNRHLLIDDARDLPLFRKRGPRNLQREEGIEIRAGHPGAGIVVHRPRNRFISAQ